MLLQPPNACTKSGLLTDQGTTLACKNGDFNIAFTFPVQTSLVPHASSCSARGAGCYSSNAGLKQTQKVASAG